MTTTKATLSFTINADKSLSLNEAKLGNQTIQAEAASKAITTVISKLQTHDEERYNLILDCKNFTATLELPPNVTKFNLKFEDKGKKWVINIPLKQETAEIFGQDLLDKLRPTSNRVNPVLALMTAPRVFPPIPTIAPLPLPPPKPFILWRLFDYLASLFSFLWKKDTSQESAQISAPLIHKTFVNPAIHQTMAPNSIFSAMASKRASSNPMATGIRPLPNEGNTCFINSIIQALMNAPGLVPALISAHETKIKEPNSKIAEFVSGIEAQQAKKTAIETAIQKLKKGQWFFHYCFTADYRRLNAELHNQIILIDSLLESQKVWEEIRDPSAALINVLRFYNDPNQDISLWPLRGLMNNRFSPTEEDASEFLQKIFEPLKPELATHLFHMFGEEKHLIEYDHTGNEELAEELKNKNGSSPLPENSIFKKLEESSILFLQLPKTKIALQDLLDKQFAPNEDPQEELVCYLNKDNEKTWYEVAAKKQVMEVSGDSAPEHLIIQFKRYDEEGLKISTKIELPANNQITILINEQHVTYEIQTLVLHSGDTPQNGHYFDYVNKNGTWFKANDSEIEPVASLPVETQTEVYVVFLKKIN